MKIERIETYLVGDRWMYLQIHTDNGITGLGEGGCWGYPGAAERIVRAWTPYLVGKNPLEIEHHWQYLYRNAHFRGAAVGAALSAIDIALWDIAGKHFEAPAYQLLGGKCRDRVRLYVHVDAPTVDEIIANARRRVAEGFTAVRFKPVLPGYESRRYDALIDEAARCVGAVREGVGPGVDLCIEIHRRFSPVEAVGVRPRGRAVSPVLRGGPDPQREHADRGAAGAGGARAHRDRRAGAHDLRVPGAARGRGNPDRPAGRVCRRRD